MTTRQRIHLCCYAQQEQAPLLDGMMVVFIKLGLVKINFF